MRSGLSLLSVAAVLCGVAVAQAAEPGTSVPWHHTAVSRLDQSHPGLAAAAEAGPQKYLHIEMQINDPTVVQNRDKFRIVDARGNEVQGSEIWGYNNEKHLLIVEGHWGSLVGLYLDGFGHREPLFDQVAVPVTPAPVVERPYVANPVIVPNRVVVPDRVVVLPVSMIVAWWWMIAAAWSSMMTCMSVIVATM